jgi:hypothetical protein
MAARKRGRPRKFKQWGHLSKKDYAKKAGTEQKRLWRANNPEKSKAAINVEADKRKSSPENKVAFLVCLAKGRAKKGAADFSISPNHVQIPTHCALREAEICYCNDGLKDNSPSLDRIDPTKGYVPGNVWVISHRANRIKNNATFEEFETIYFNWRAELIRRGELKP